MSVIKDIVENDIFFEGTMTFELFNSNIKVLIDKDNEDFTYAEQIILNLNYHPQISEVMEF